MGEKKQVQIYGCWGIPNHPHECEVCGSELIECPREGHPNSKFWKLEREDGLVLLVCPNNCPEKEENMKKHEIHILKVDASILDILSAFVFDQLIQCPKMKPRDFRAKKEYSEDEERILSLIPNATNAITLFCPTVCSGLRGDGSRFRDKCEHFDSYGENKDQVFSFHNPQKFVNCKKHGKVKIEDYANSCVKREITVAAARGRGLIHHFGSADLEKVKKDVCLTCSHFKWLTTSKGDVKVESCNFKPGCKRGEGYILCLDMDWCYGDCDTCEKNDERKTNESVD